MKKIYIKNYKGFDEQVIMLKDVNFFVGENSTGKTSILKLINIINSREFWFNGQFNNSEVDLGYFDEIINRNSSDDFFRIGVEIPDNEKKSFIRVLLEFKEHKSIPKISQIKYQTNNVDSLMEITKNQIRYYTRVITDSSFLDWSQDFNYGKSIKSNDISSDDKLPLFILFHF